MKTYSHILFNKIYSDEIFIKFTWRAWIIIIKSLMKLFKKYFCK